ncbi:MAG TPA: TatD family hydrolase [Propionibacteriaceae bacterium]|nr:TatD family hydrolase [Propionibacteriaceae bacterium]HPZ48679.1 TatD family hydrolase [Propionibacteriaceae bacterium]HQE31132.1 TatD family hydrolase [Propionibacteriaceae bacterium]
MASYDTLLADRGLPPAPAPLPASVVDAHTHLDAAAAIDGGLTPALAMEIAASVGVERLVQVGCDAAGSEWAVALAEEAPTVVANVALHPNEVARHPERVAEGLETIARLARNPHVRGVGETGLDYFRTTDPAEQARQRDAFAAHIEIARERGLTLVIHDRDAHDDILDVLAAQPLPDRVVMHCFSGDAAFARRCADLGFWLSFPGVVTYPANSALREALAVTPRTQLLVETDAPYLTPVPARGKRNSPYLLAHTVRFVAERRGWDLTAACRQMSANAFAAFGGHWGDDG